MCFDNVTQPFCQIPEFKCFVSFYISHSALFIHYNVLFAFTFVRQCAVHTTIKYHVRSIQSTLVSDITQNISTSQTCFASFPHPPSPPSPLSLSIRAGGGTGGRGGRGRAGGRSGRADGLRNRARGGSGSCGVLRLRYRSHPGPMSARRKADWRQWPSALKRTQQRRDAATARAEVKTKLKVPSSEILNILFSSVCTIAYYFSLRC